MQGTKSDYTEYLSEQRVELTVGTAGSTRYSAMAC